MSKDTGGPAFPAHENWRIDSGMTLRDYFAAKAMQGLLIGEIAVPEKDDHPFANLANASYMLADAMLAERSKP